MPLLLMCAKDQILKNTVRSLCFTCFVCFLLNFHARKFPAKSENQEPGGIIVELTSYLYSRIPLCEKNILLTGAFSCQDDIPEGHLDQVNESIPVSCLQVTLLCLCR